MKKAFMLMVSVLGILIIATPTNAVPLLQLDIGGGTYDSSSETIVTFDPIFTLYALFDGSKKKSPRLSDPFYIAAALVPITPNPTGSFSFTWNEDDNSFSSTGPISGTPAGLPAHGIFPVQQYWEFEFKFSPSYQVPQYNTQDYPGGFGTADDGSGNQLYFASFNVDVGGLDGYALHFDLYHKSDNPGHVDGFAPFSHDAAAVVPEPATMLLLGVGLIGMAVVGRKRFVRR